MLQNHMTQKAVSIMTLGCRVNQYESDSVASKLKENNIKIVPFGEKCDIAVINTCTVTSESDKKSRQMIHRALLFADHVVVTGCYAQISGDEESKNSSVTYFRGNSGKAGLADTVMNILAGINEPKVDIGNPDNISAVESILETPMRTRSYIKIEDGCNNSCSYCLIHTARGPVRSKSPETVLKEAEILSTKGNAEIILTGIETASYGLDFQNRRPYGYHLADLITAINKIESVKRIGIASLDPSVFTDYFTETVAKAEKLLPHFHISLQSGSSRILASMKRKYNRDMALKSFERIKKNIPDATFSADIIVGYPGETDEDFDDTLSICEQIQFLHLHIFPYSKRIGTPAAEMKDQIPAQIKKERLKRLSELGLASKEKILDDYVKSHTESPVFVLVEKADAKSYKGHSEHFAEVIAENAGERPKVGDIVPTVLTHYDEKYVYGIRKMP